MLDDVNHIFRQAQSLQKRGDYAEAESLYGKILTLQPGHVDSLHFLGVIAYQTQRYEEAERLICDAIRLKPNVSAYHSNLGLVYRDTDRLELAAESLGRAIQLQPSNRTAIKNLGIVKMELGFADESTALFEQIAPLSGSDRDAHFRLGQSLLAQKRYDFATKQFEKALAINPLDAEAHNGRGTALQKLGRRDEAAESFKSAVRCDPNFDEAHSNLGLVFMEMGQLSEAETVLRNAIAISPRSVRCLSSLGVVTLEQGRLEEAKEMFLKAVSSKPDDAIARSNLGAVYFQLGELENALQTLEAALRLQPNIVDARWNRSLALLAAGRFVEGWLEYEWRWLQKGRKLRNFPKPRWDGAPIEGKTILLHAEQGFGDTIQFLRYANHLKQAGGKVLLACQKPLVPLLSCSDLFETVALGQPRVPRFDVHAPLMSVPSIVGTDLDSIPKEVPYLKADPRLASQWQQRLASLPGIKVGIAWQGSEKYRGDRYRSIPLAYYAPLAEVPNVTLVSLQNQAISDEARQQSDAMGILCFDDMDQASGAFMDTAAIIENLDLVITSDTCIPHLAAALGCEVWMALSTVPDWRWFFQGDESPWYPKMKLFRQETRGDWEEVFARLAIQLRAFVSNKQKT